MDKIKIYAPADKSYIAEVDAMDKDIIEEKIKKLKKGFINFKNLSITKRAEYLYKLVDVLDENKEELAKMVSVEISKSYKDSLNEVVRSIEMTKYIIEEGIRLKGEIYEGDSYAKKDKIAIVRREALGIVLCIAPFNYPINLSLSKIIPALITGNVVLFKPATQASYVCTKLVELLNKVLPENVLEVVTGYGRVIGDYINTHKDIKYINFTGSTEVGKKIIRDAGMKGIMLELGGKDAAIVLKDANLKKAAKEIVEGAFSYSGQRCTAIKRVLVEKTVKNELTNLLLEEIKKLKIGLPSEDVTITPLIDEKSAEYIEYLIKDAKDKGAKVLIGDKREANLVYPCLLTDVKLDMEVAFKEPFGPVLPIIEIENEDEAIEIANMSDYGLQSSVFTEDFKKAMYIAKKLEVGTVQINNKTQRGPDNFPFLGIKDSGMGVQGIKDSILAMTRIKSIVLDI